MKDKLKVGQTIFYREFQTRRGQDSSLKESTVKTVGNKYFTLEPDYIGRFFIDNLMHDSGQYSSRYKAYLNKEEYEVEVETKRLSDKLRKIFQGFRIDISLKKMAQIEAIIDSEEV